MATTKLDPVHASRGNRRPVRGTADATATNSTGEPRLRMDRTWPWLSKWWTALRYGGRDKANRARFLARMAGSRGPDDHLPAVVGPVNARTRGLIESLLRTQSIREDDRLFWEEDFEIPGECPLSARDSCRLDELPADGFKLLCILATDEVQERMLADLDYRHGAFSINDAELVDYPTVGSFLDKPYRHLRMRYTNSVVPPLHFSNYTYLQYLKTFVTSRMIVADAFSGPGTVGLSLAKECRLGEVTLFDLNPTSVEMMNENVRANFSSSFTARTFQSDLFTALPSELKFDLIVGNPPHNLDQRQEFANQPKMLFVQAFDPAMECHRAFFQQARSRLLPGGKICLLENGHAECIQVHHLRELLHTLGGWRIESHVPMVGSSFYAVTIVPA